MYRSYTPKFDIFAVNAIKQGPIGRYEYCRKNEKIIKERDNWFVILNDAPYDRRANGVWEGIHYTVFATNNFCARTTISPIIKRQLEIGGRLLINSRKEQSIPAIPHVHILIDR